MNHDKHEDHEEHEGYENHIEDESSLLRHRMRLASPLTPQAERAMSETIGCAISSASSARPRIPGIDLSKGHVPPLEGPDCFGSCLGES